jgi:diguanylate cyclase (GGDEF)-like protein
VVIADGLGGNDVTALGECIRREIAAAPTGDPAGKVTASIGVATCASDASGCDRLFEIADKRLYEAKALGRNRVIGARSPNGENPMRLVKS